MNVAEEIDFIVNYRMLDKLLDDMLIDIDKNSFK